MEIGTSTMGPRLGVRFWFQGRSPFVGTSSSTFIRLFGSLIAMERFYTNKIRAATARKEVTAAALEEGYPAR